VVRSDLLTLKDIDSLLASWKARLSTAAQNLVELRGHPRYQGPAGQQVGPLFQKLAQIQQVVDQASDLRKDWPMFGAEERIRDIERLLHGKSIELPAVPVPIEQRTLLSAVERQEYVTLDDLMNSLVHGFAAARDSVFAIDSAWLKLSELRRYHAESCAIHKQCQEQITDHAKLAEPAAEEKIDALRQWLERLEQRSGDGQLTAVSIGLQNWNKAVETCVNSEREATAKNRAMLDMRNELRGRLDALKAKARASGINEGPELVGIAREAATCLQLKPVPLGRAATLVQAYETRLRMEMKK
jgi:hypothetical protein